MRRGRSGAIVLSAAAVLGLFGAGPSARAEILEEVVAKVNNSIITRSQFQERLSTTREQLSAHYTGAELDAKMATIQDSLLHDMVIETLLVQRADVLLDMDKVRKNLLDDFKKQQKIATDDELDRLLKEQKMTRHDLLETLIRLSIPQEVVNYEVRRKISVSDKDIQAYYNAHHQDFVKPERVLFREIVILFEDAARTEARSRADAVKRQLDAGADFASLVAQESQAASKDRGGLAGPFTRGELRPEIEKTVFALQPGQVAGPIESARAFHFFRLETREAEQTTPLADARDGIIEKIRDGKFKEKLDEYLKKLWADNYIYVFPKYGTSDWKPVGVTEKGVDLSP